MGISFLNYFFNRFMQQGKHIGKVILALDPEESVQVLSPEFKFDNSVIYLLIGGLGGFGSAVAKWMAQNNAKKLAFISRSGASTPSALQTVSSIVSIINHTTIMLIIYYH